MGDFNFDKLDDVLQRYLPKDYLTQVNKYLYGAEPM